MIDRKTPPTYGKIESFNFPFPETYTLSNNIKVYALPGHFEQALRIDFCFKAGDKYHPNPIVAHAVNQLITEGTKTKNSAQIANEFDLLGSFLDKECGTDFAKITVFSLEENLSKLLPLIKDTLTDAIFPNNEIEIYKNIKNQKL
ncbi:MAG: insulinase family protein, partial [Bacteroidetes bacterium]|nr:insulinase family protein [Bacteroidota bacterium]